MISHQKNLQSFQKSEFLGSEQKKERSVQRLFWFLFCFKKRNESPSEVFCQDSRTEKGKGVLSIFSNREEKEEFAPYRTHKGKHKRATAPTEKNEFFHQAQNLLFEFLVFVRH